ncbi:MAG: hypothetical protein ABI400_06175 [Lacisediminihabitans sp.]
MSSADSIDDYLDDLAEHLTASPDRTRRFLAEVESHLRDESEASVSKGIEQLEAEISAIRSFGTTAQIAKAENHISWKSSRSSVIAASFGLVLRLVTIGMIVIGLAGGAAQIFANFGLVNAIYGLPSNVIMSASSCAHWLAVQPTAATCQQAGTLEASNDLPMIYFATGFLGLLLAIPVFIVWFRHRTTRKVLPATLGPAISSAMFGAAAIGLFSLGVTNAVISTTWGKGVWLIDATAALIVCAVSLALLLRAIRRSYVSPNV